jgi:hypothetical protein
MSPALTIATPITGRETAIDPTHPSGAVADLYRAFNARDLMLMARNWDLSHQVSMDNPLGGIRRGWNDIRPVYERLFTGSVTVTVEFHDYTLHRFSDAFLAVGREREACISSGSTIELRIRTSRWFRLMDGRWRQFHYQASIEDTDMLARYRDAVR